MTQYILHISSYGGLVPGATHYRGRIEGPHPPSCHGGTIFHGAKGPLHGKTTCAEDHELPEQIRWDVEAAWSPERRKRWAAAKFEDSGPQQFDSKQDVIDRAIIQFLDGSEFPCEEVTPAEEGDELWHGWVNPGGGQFDADTDEEDGWGMMIARKCTS